MKVCVASSLGAAEPPDEVGASLVLDTTMLKSVVTAAELPSVQVTLTDSVPTLALIGVPLKVLVLAVNVIQLERALPSV